MKKQIIVNAEDLESRVAILEDGQLAELQIEREQRMVGSIYKARVVSVLPGMDAAFADIALPKNVFLCADDVGFVSRDGVTMKAAPRSATISERLRENQEVVVQIVRAPVASKGARATTRLALPGRYLVLLLYDGRQVGVSRKIEERKERERLRKIGEKLRPHGMGLIIRTEAEGRGQKELEADLKVLLDLRDRLMAKAAETRAPALLHQDLTLTYQVIRDVFTEDVDSLVIDSKSVYESAVELVNTIAPNLRSRVKRYRGRLPIFHKYGIEGEMDRLLRRRVWMRTGGYISIDQAEAFTAIDVNTGRFTGSSGLADTILRTNLEAAEEIARQLRLRDLGGVIVIDFIDMERSRHRQRVMKAFEQALKRDRQKTKIVHLSPLGLVEMTRKRRGESLMGILTETCPLCAGLGRIRNALTIALKLERDARRLAVEHRPEALLLRAAPRVAALIVGDEGQRAAALEKTVGRPVYARADEHFGIEEHELTGLTLAALTKQVRTFAKGDEVTVTTLDPQEPAGEEGVYGWGEGYRVLIRDPAPGDPPLTVVLTKVDHSFGEGYVKGKEPAAAETRKAEKKRPRRRGGRRRAAPKEALETPLTEADEPLLQAPLQPEPEEEPPVAASPEPEQPAARRKPRSRRGGRRRKRAPEAEAAQPREPTPEPRETTPQPPEGPPQPPPPPITPDQPEASAAAPRRGLLRRGERRIVRPRR